MRRRTAAVIAATVAVWLAAGCAATPNPAPEAKRYRMEGKNTMIWLDEFHFERPPESWRLVQVEEGDEFAFAFIKQGGCPFPCQSTFAFDQEPFGYSMDLAKRMAEFYRRFLWASGIQFGELKTERVRVLGGDGLAALAEGKDPVIGHKVWTKVVLGKRGERVVGFYVTQWRTMDGSYDEADVADFDRFVESFRFLKKSFYETL